jgi:hypothetical protein
VARCVEELHASFYSVGRILSGLSRKLCAEGPCVCTSARMARAISSRDIWIKDVVFMYVVMRF